MVDSTTGIETSSKTRTKSWVAQEVASVAEASDIRFHAVCLGFGCRWDLDRWGILFHDPEKAGPADLRPPVRPGGRGAAGGEQNLRENSTGGVCRKWDTQELTALGIAIKNRVKTLVKYQQTRGRRSAGPPSRRIIIR